MKRFLLLAHFLLLAFLPSSALTAWAQPPAEAIAPVRVGDEIEVKYASKWYPGKVTGYSAGKAMVNYKWGSSFWDREFELKDMRFPRGEGHWMIWNDASGQFSIEGRYISRTADQVTIRKPDGQDIQVPIEKLAAKLRRMIAQTPVTGEENKVNGAAPVRVGDGVQVKYYFGWYDGTVKEVITGAAKVEFNYRSDMRTEEFELEDIRFPDGQGPWREWSDQSGNFKIIARYLHRDETHVTIRKEDGTDLRVDIALLSGPLRKLLANTPIITPTPKQISFASSATNARAFSPEGVQGFEEVSLPLSGASQTLAFRDGGVAFEIPFGDSISAAFPIGGPQQLVAVGTFASSRKDAPKASQMFWASVAGSNVVDGPLFHPDHRIVAYSAEQSRLITTRVQGTWDEPYQFCSYRVAAGEKIATPEARWDIPPTKRSSSRGSKFKVELVGNDRLLFGYDSSVALYNFATRRIEYAVENLGTHVFFLNPSRDLFLAFGEDGGLGLYEVATGHLVGQQKGSRYGGKAAGFSQDGMRLLRVSNQGIDVWNLTRNESVTQFRRGGLSVPYSLFFEPPQVALLDGGWITVGSQFYSTGLEMLVWQYLGRSVNIDHREMIGNQMLAVATAGGFRGPKTALVGVATVPHQDAIELMKQVDTDNLLMLRRGAKIRIQASGDRRIIDGLRRAAAANGWVEDPGSDVLLTGEAKLGKAEKRTYQKISFGFGAGPPTTEEHTVQPWIQSVSIRYGEKEAWGTSGGGVPWSMSLSKGESIGGKLQESSRPSYSLFENLTIPAEILYPRYQQGLGRTFITPNGFVDQSSDE